MYNKIIIIVLLVISISGCSKDEKIIQQDLSVDPIVGTWKLFESYVSPGGETTWQAVEDGYEYTFGADGTFLVNGETDCEGLYTRSEEALIITQICDGSSDEVNFTMNIQSLEEMELVIYNSLCIEGCIYRFKRIM